MKKLPKQKRNEIELLIEKQMKVFTNCIIKIIQEK